MLLFTPVHLLQLCCGADGLHEEQNPGQVFPGPPGVVQALAASGFIPAQTGSEDPQIPPAAPGTKHWDGLYRCQGDQSMFSLVRSYSRSSCRSGDRQALWPWGGGLRGGGGGHLHHDQGGMVHQWHEEEARARRQTAGQQRHPNVIILLESDSSPGLEDWWPDWGSFVNTFDVNIKQCLFPLNSNTVEVLEF